MTDEDEMKPEPPKTLNQQAVDHLREIRMACWAIFFLLLLVSAIAACSGYVAMMYR